MVNIWNLNRGDLFKVLGSDIILEFYKIDGAYVQCTTLTGQAALVGLQKVELVQGR
jgi:hypothetical protein